MAIIANIFFSYQNKNRSVRDDVKVNIGVYNDYMNLTGNIYLNVEGVKADNLIKDARD